VYIKRELEEDMGGGWPEQHAWETGSAGDGKMERPRSCNDVWILLLHRVAGPAARHALPDASRAVFSHPAQSVELR
jgi:hypothetical protein